MSGSGDTTLKVWDAQTGQETLTLKGHSSDVNSVSFSPDGKRIVSGSVDKTMDPNRGPCVHSNVAASDRQLFARHSPPRRVHPARVWTPSSETWGARVYRGALTVPLRSPLACGHGVHS